MEQTLRESQQERAGSHMVTTTSSSFATTLTSRSSTLAYDKEFLKTIPGVLMVVEIVLGLLVWMLIAGTDYFLYPVFGWIMFVAVFYWILTLFFLIVYMTMTYTRIPQVPWTTVLLLLVGFICVRSSQWTDHNAYSYFEFVCIYDLIMIFIFYIIYIFRAYRKLTCISWPLAEFLHYLIGTILLLIASIVGVAKSSNSAGLVAGAMLPCKSFATSKCAQLLREELRKTCKMEWCIEMILKSILTGPRVPSSGTFQLLLGLLFQQPVSFGLIFGSWETRRAAVKDPVGRKESIF